MGKRKKKSVTSVPIASLEAQAHQHIVDRQFKKALHAYKALLKHQPENAAQQKNWQRALIVCYKERINELVSKALFKEAAALLENVSELPYFVLAKDAPLLIAYIRCLLKTGKTGKACALYLANQPMIEKEAVGKPLATEFAVRLLLDDKQCLDVFSAESPIRQQCNDAQAALDIFCSDDKSSESRVAFDAACKQISFRSPFKDLVFILKALTAFDADPGEPESGADKATALMRKVSKESAFFSFAEYLLPVVTAHIDKALLKLTSAQFQFVGVSLGWTRQQGKFVHDALKHSTANPKSQFNFLIGLPSSLLSMSRAKKACFTLLLDYPAGRSIYQKRFGKLSPLDGKRLDALRAEKVMDRHDAYHKWVDFSEKMDDEQLGSHRLTALEQAAVYRQIAEHDVMGGFSLHGCGISSVEAWDFSLHLDPDDITTHKNLIEFYENEQENKEYQQSIERAVKQFPADRDMLTLAIESAMKKGAFKKAAGFAKKLLKKDSLNAFAKQALIDSHLSHARKQVRLNKSAVAEKEIALALSFKPTGNALCQAMILSGLLDYLNADSAKKMPTEKKKTKTQAIVKGSESLETPETMIKQALKKADNSLVAQFLLYFEGLRCYLSKKVVFTGFTPAFTLDKQVDATMILALVKQLQLSQKSFQEGDLTHACLSLEQLQKPIIAAGHGLAKRMDFDAVCDCFYTYKAFSLLGRFAKAAMKQHSEVIVFQFYDLFSQVDGKPQQVTEKQEDQLARLLARAEETNDKRAEVRVRDFLIAVDNSRRFFHPSSDSGGFGLPMHPFAGGVADMEDTLAAMLEGMGPEAVVKMMGEALGISTSDAESDEVDNEALFLPKSNQKKPKKKGKSKGSKNSSAGSDTPDMNLNIQDEWEF